MKLGPCPALSPATLKGLWNMVTARWTHDTASPSSPDVVSFARKPWESCVRDQSLLSPCRVVLDNPPPTNIGRNRNRGRGIAPPALRKPFMCVCVCVCVCVCERDACVAGILMGREASLGRVAVEARDGIKSNMCLRIRVRIRCCLSFVCYGVFEMLHTRS